MFYPAIPSSDNAVATTCLVDKYKSTSVSLIPISPSMLFPANMLWSGVLAALLASQLTLAQTTQDIAQLFEVNKIVPDLLPSFNPTVLLEVSYNTTVIPGEILSQVGTSSSKPYLTIFPAAAMTPKLGVQGTTPDSQFVFIMVLFFFIPVCLPSLGRSRRPTHSQSK